MMTKAFIGALFVSLLISPATALERLPSIPPAQFDDEQKKAAEEFFAARKAQPSGLPWTVLMHSPEVMNRARAMGDYLRFGSTIGMKLSEFVIMITAREWSSDYIWGGHYPIALREGVAERIVAAVADGRRPSNMSDDEEMTYDFSTELHKNKRVSDETYNRVEKRFGKKGVVDMTAINAYYTLLAMEINMSRAEPPANNKKLGRFPD